MSKQKCILKYPIQETGEGTTKMCYAGTVNLPHRNSSASLTPGRSLPGPPQ